jgi:hypothetical protein
MSTSIVTDIQPSLDVEHVLRGQGIDPTRARPRLVAAAESMLDEARSLLDPVAMYTILPVRDFHHQTVVLDGGATFEGPLVARALAGATEVVLVVCTIGPALEEQAGVLFTADVVRAMALDGAGNAALGEVARQIVARICDEASARGLDTGMHANPGQEGWPIEQQRLFFDLVPAQEIGVRLTESYLMLPRKSVSFVVGLGPEMRPGAVTCDFCSKRERCPWRIDR